MTSDPSKRLDQLPPHSDEAEAGVLSCILQEPARYHQANERFGGQQPFYDGKNALIWAAMTGLAGEAKGIDFLTLSSRLRDTGNLDAAGGHSYLSRLGDISPSPLMLGDYLEIVWSKALARRGFNEVTDWAAQVFSAQEMTAPLLGEIRRRIEALDADASRHQATPKHLKTPGDFGEEFWARYFGGTEEEPGLPLPIDFKLKIRPGESTLITGDDGAGKSTVLAYFALHLMEAGMKALIASFEMPGPVTLWILASQLLAAKRQPDCEAGRRKVTNALAWLNRRLLLYDFLGIGDWRDVLDTFRYAAEKQGVKLFVLDSVMRIGIPDDDYATQAVAAARFDQFCKDHQAHLFYVVHENKSDGKGKARVRGSKLWTGNACNVLRVERNAEKGEKISKAYHQLGIERKAGKPDQRAIKALEEEIRDRQQAWDTHLVLQKQRYPGTQQNGSRYIFYDPNCFQFRTHHSDYSIAWLERWSKEKTQPSETNHE